MDYFAARAFFAGCVLLLFSAASALASNNPVLFLAPTLSPSAAAPPPGLTANFVGNPVVGGAGSATLSILTSASTPTGRYNIPLTGTSGSRTHTTNLILDVNSAADFSGTVSPGQQTVPPGGSTSFTGQVLSICGFSGNVRLTLSGLPRQRAEPLHPRS